MIMKRKLRNFGLTTSILAAILLATTSFAGNYAKRSDIVDTNSRVVMTGIDDCNGVIHVDDTDVLPTD